MRLLKCVKCLHVILTLLISVPSNLNQLPESGAWLFSVKQICRVEIIVCSSVAKWCIHFILSTIRHSRFGHLLFMVIECRISMPKEGWWFVSCWACVSCELFTPRILGRTLSALGQRVPVQQTTPAVLLSFYYSGNKGFRTKNLPCLSFTVYGF